MLAPAVGARPPNGAGPMEDRSSSHGNPLLQPEPLAAERKLSALLRHNLERSSKGSGPSAAAAASRQLEAESALESAFAASLEKLKNRLHRPLAATETVPAAPPGKPAAAAGIAPSSSPSRPAWRPSGGSSSRSASPSAARSAADVKGAAAAAAAAVTVMGSSSTRVAGKELLSRLTATNAAAIQRGASPSALHRRSGLPAAARPRSPARTKPTMTLQARSPAFGTPEEENFSGGPPPPAAALASGIPGRVVLQEAAQSRPPASAADKVAAEPAPLPSAKSPGKAAAAGSGQKTPSPPEAARAAPASSPGEDSFSMLSAVQPVSHGSLDAEIRKQVADVISLHIEPLLHAVSAARPPATSEKVEDAVLNSLQRKVEDLVEKQVTAALRPVGPPDMPAPAQPRPGAPPEAAAGGRRHVAAEVPPARSAAPARDDEELPAKSRRCMEELDGLSTAQLASWARRMLHGQDDDELAAWARAALGEEQLQERPATASRFLASSRPVAQDVSSSPRVTHAARQAAARSRSPVQPGGNRSRPRSASKSPRQSSVSRADQQRRDAEVAAAADDWAWTRFFGTTQLLRLEEERQRFLEEVERMKRRSHLDRKLLEAREEQSRRLLDDFAAQERMLREAISAQRRLSSASRWPAPGGGGGAATQPCRPSAGGPFAGRRAVLTRASSAERAKSLNAAARESYDFMGPRSYRPPPGSDALHPLWK
eukprot:TRINITY_DN32820_c0_g1_i1.p1 TRINITY_DN32820_c0_g1~~TRINITY_DN32820_c0_g1_i1.p1  ORF type:complete len:713 (+),score=182.07 TRINITY_DN32820_c0_g1_i1:93-2231(+)